MSVVIHTKPKGFDPNEDKKPDLTFLDVRFTTKGKTLYALVQGWPTSELVIRALATNSPSNPKRPSTSASWAATNLSASRKTPPASA